MSDAIRCCVRFATCVVAATSAFADGRLSDGIEDAIRQRVESGKIVGIVVGMIDGRGREYFSAGRVGGGREGEPDENTLFEIGSITKTFVGILLADLVERGEAALDDPIDKYLPDGVKSPTRGGKRITLLDLATHRSGLPRMPGNFQPADPRDPYADYSTERLFAFLDGYEPGRDIGEKYEYSNLGFGLLGTLLSRRAGTGLEDVITSRITSRLGMSDTAMTLPPELRKRLAQGHRGETAVSNWDFDAFAGAGAIRSSARDMLIYLAANLGLTETPLSPVMRHSHERRADAGSKKMAIGLGWHIRLGGEHRIIWHNGGTGGYRTFAGFEPEQKRGIVILTNSSHTTPDDIGFHWLDASLPLSE